MVLSYEEQNKLELFKNITLNRDQIDALLNRKITSSEWKSINSKDYKKVFTPIAIQAAKSATRKGYLKTVEVCPLLQLKHTFKTIAEQAAKVAARKQIKVAEEPSDKYHFTTSLFKKSSDEYTINKIRTHYNSKYKTSITDWKVTGSVNLFNVNKVIEALIQKITANLPENVKIQIVLKTADRQPDTKLLSKDKIINLLTEWVNYFIDYKDNEDISDVIFQVVAIELPQGTGRARAIINLDEKRCITQIKNTTDTICLVRAI